MFIVLLLLLWMASPVMAAQGLRTGSDEWLVNGLGWVTAVLLWLLYERGANRSPVKPWRRWLFRITVVLALLTALGPMDRLAQTSAAMHMAQHMLMIALIAPLFAVAKPLPQFYVAAARYGRSIWQAFFKVTQYPMLCAYLHGVVIWFWHIPLFYMAAVQNSWLHAVSHLCFLITAVWFWWACLYPNPRKLPFALLALLLTLMHTGFLGALLTFAAQPLYSEARHLQDQQLAGLLMWVLGGIPYMVAAVWAGHRWYKQIDRRIHSA